MEDPQTIILLSTTSELKIRFSRPLDVTNRKIALLSVQHPHIYQSFRRGKRLIKDEISIDELETVFIFCDAIKENVHVNKVDSDISVHPIQCIDVVHLEIRPHQVTKLTVQEPIYHEFSTNILSSLTVNLCDMNFNNLNFSKSSPIVVKLLIK
jgi:hypothetical protein